MPGVTALAGWARSFLEALGFAGAISSASGCGQRMLGGRSLREAPAGQ